MYRLGTAIIIAATLITGGAFAQTPKTSGDTTPPPEPRPDAKTWQFWVKGQAHTYPNFFQAADGQPHETINAEAAEAGASLRLSRTMPLRAYGNLNYVHYGDRRLGNSPGARLGLRLDGKPHTFNVYVEQLKDRPSFAIGNQFDRADVRNLRGEYAYRFASNWEVTALGELQHQNVRVTSSRDNDWRNAGAGLRWRGSTYFSPEIGFEKGTRKVNDSTFSYDQDDRYLSIVSMPIAPLWINVRYTDRKRDYTTGNVASQYFGRSEKRPEIMLTASWALQKNFSIDFWGSHEKVDVNRPGQDFQDTMALLGFTYKF